MGPKDLKRFAKEHGAGPGWTSCTGKPADILRLRRARGFTYYDPKEDAHRNNHTGMLPLCDEPLCRWASAEGGARPGWLALVIRTGVRQTGPTVRKN